MHTAVECETCGTVLHDLDAVQKQLADWQYKNFPYDRSTTDGLFMGIVEEVGELAHARLKMKQGIRESEVGLREEELDAVGDILIYLINYCSVRHISFSGALDNTMSEVLSRDWTVFPVNGKDK